MISCKFQNLHMDNILFHVCIEYYGTYMLRFELSCVCECESHIVVQSIFMCIFRYTYF